MKEELEILKQCKVENEVIYLPEIQLSRELYVKVKKALSSINYNWVGGKTQGFVNKKGNGIDLFNKVINEENLNIKKDYQFFETPENIVNKLIELAEINENVKTILEPSAGRGSIVKGIFNNIEHYVNIDMCELMDENWDYLNEFVSKELKNGNILINLLLEKDFLNFPVRIQNEYDRVIANPPFSKNQDITHVIKMYEHLNKKGILVSVMSKHFLNSEDPKSKLFKEFLSDKNVEIINLSAGEFKESGTNIETIIIKIKK